MEHWNDIIKGHQASDHGQIRSLDRWVAVRGHGRKRVRGRILTTHLRGGYLRVGLSQGGGMKNYSVHQLVAAAFLGPCPEGQQVRHGSGGKLDNSISNLSYGTRSQDGLDKRRDGTHGGRRVRRSDGVEYASMAIAAEESGCANGIGNVCRGYRKTCGGYGWEYVDSLPIKDVVVLDAQQKSLEHWTAICKGYQVSNLTRVRSLARWVSNGHGRKRRVRGQILTPHLSNTGYWTVGLTRDGVKKSCLVHQLVATAFLGPCPKGQVVRHGPAGKLDNSISNLSYGTRSQDGLDRRRDGTDGSHRVRRSDGVEFASMAIAAEETNCPAKNIGNVCRRQLKTSGGYGWRYADSPGPDTWKVSPLGRCVKRSDGVEFPGRAIAAEESGCSANAISQVCRGRQKTTGGYGWRYADISGPNTWEVSILGGRVRRSDGVEFASLTIAAEESGCRVSGISQVCRGRQKTCGGYGWRYVDEPGPETWEVSPGRCVKRSDGVEFASLAIAAEDTGCSEDSIRQTCQGRQKTCGGYGWRYADSPGPDTWKASSGRCVRRSDGVEFPGMAIAAEESGCSAGHISQVCRGRRKTCGGYGWEYV